MVVTKDKAEKFTSLLRCASNILLVGHTNPDGDSIGSLMGARAYIKAMYPSCFPVVAVPTDYPDFLKFLDAGGHILNFLKNGGKVKSAVKKADLIICLDFNALSRIDALGKLVGASGAKKILIDHHPQPEGGFDLTVSTTEVSSTCELLYWLLRKTVGNKKDKINSDCGNALYVGMMTDTNNFSNSVFPSTFKMAAELMAMGVDKESLQYKVLSCFSEDRMRLMGHMLLKSMKIYPHYKAACMVLDKKTKDKFNYKDGDSEGFVNLPLNISGVEISALFTESENFVRVSLRSKGDFSVNRLGRAYYNGGGHERAAGGRLYMPITKVEKYFIDTLRHTF